MWGGDCYGAASTPREQGDHVAGSAGMVEGPRYEGEMPTYAHPGCVCDPRQGTHLCGPP